MEMLCNGDLRLTDRLMLFLNLQYPASNQLLDYRGFVLPDCRWYDNCG
ncbi:hypothetical protein EV13_3046 [Prochlorococcus sp. MIT 0702]|nr:hypothetical protein EV13_3046 [Prochlorococcus sp. MIT 0702]KGG31990.1 hypothetical protein EV14_2115 [Prochlorococcus sp. MIT 0703]